MVYSTYHNMTETGLDVTIATALEEATTIEVTDVISDFSDYVDPDALNRIFRVRHDEHVRRPGEVEITVEEYDIVIDSEGEIEILR